MQTICFHQVGTSFLLIYMMHGHTYIKFTVLRAVVIKHKEK